MNVSTLNRIRPSDRVDDLPRRSVVAVTLAARDVRGGGR